MNVAATRRCPYIWHVGGEDVRLRISLLLALKSRGFRVGAIGSEEGRDFKEIGIPYWQYPLNRSVNLFADLRSISQLYKLFRTHRPDIVHSFDTKPSVYVPLIAQRARITGCVRTVTGMGQIFSSESLRMRMLRPIYRMLQKKASAAAHMTVFQNRDDQAYFVTRGLVSLARQTLVLGSGIEVESKSDAGAVTDGTASLRDKLRIDARQIVVTMVSRIIKQKGVREYIAAAEMVTKQYADVVFLLVGPTASEGSQAINPDELEKSAGFVRYLGPRNDVPALLGITDIVVLPSYYREGVPRVLMEAGVAGLPIITTDMPGCREVVRNGWNGLVVPPRDAMSLAQAMIQLILAPKEERVTMGCRSRSHVAETFSLTAVADAHAEIYDQVYSREKGTNDRR